MVAVRDAASWLKLANCYASIEGRKHALKEWLVGNGKWTRNVPRWNPDHNGRPAFWRHVMHRTDEMVRLIMNGKIDPYDSVNNLISHMQRAGYSSSTTVSYKFLVLGFLRYCKTGVTREGARDETRVVRRIYSLSSKIPTIEQVRAILFSSTSILKDGPPPYHSHSK